jgi:uncharacterized protein (DUF433 family)
VRSVLAGLAAGETQQRLAEPYGITEDDIRAATGFANQLVSDWDQYPVRS